MGAVRTGQDVRAPQPTRWKLVVLKLLGAAVPVVTIGMGGWLLTGALAIKRRSIALGLSAAGYLGVMLTFVLYVVESDLPELSDGQFLVVMLHLLAAVACSVQAAVVIGSPRRGEPPQAQYHQPPQLQPQFQPPPSPDAVLRNHARQIAATQPTLARSLGIGRPDLPRQFDDGGLIDLNGAPADLLDTLPGITGRQAAAIVVSRTQYGRFRVVDELWTRGLLPAHLAPQLADRLVIIDVQDS